MRFVYIRFPSMLLKHGEGNLIQLLDVKNHLY